MIKPEERKAVWLSMYHGAMTGILRLTPLNREKDVILAKEYANRGLEEYEHRFKE